MRSSSRDASATEGDYLRSWAAAALIRPELSAETRKVLKISLLPDSLPDTAPDIVGLFDEYGEEKETCHQLVGEISSQSGKQEVTLHLLLQEQRSWRPNQSVSLVVRFSLPSLQKGAVLTLATDILAGLMMPGRTLAFCDDTELSGAPVAWLAPDLRVLCGLTMPSESYTAVESSVAGRLAILGQTEFHATEIVNPKAASSWKQVPIAQRLEALKFLSGLLADPSIRLYYAFVSKGQYEQLRAQAQKVGAVSAGYKAGLKRVFLRCLFERLGAPGTEAVVIMDQNKPLAAPAVENWPEGAFLVGGGPIGADSSAIAGLQLADMAAFSISRYLQKRATIAAEEGAPFDMIALETMASFAGRSEHLLNAATTGGENDR